LEGAIRISGAKNAILPVMAATLLSKGESLIKNAPDLIDVRTMSALLRSLGATVDFDEGTLRVYTSHCDGVEIPYELTRTMRASIYTLGPLLALKGEARIGLPGGDIWGSSRLLDFHIESLERLEATIRVKKNHLEARADKLTGAEIRLGFPSLSATCSTLMAATLARGETVIKNASQAPEARDLAKCLVNMGARIDWVGGNDIKVIGVDELHPIEHTIIPDRCETGTYMVASAITRGDVLLEACSYGHLSAIISVLEKAKVRIKRIGNNVIRVYTHVRPEAVDVTTAPYPGFLTDMQPPMTTLLTLAKGISTITETIFPDRFGHVPELKGMGADIELRGNTAIINGVQQLRGERVMANDIRSGAALVLAGLVAEGETVVYQAENVDRGYEAMERKLSAIGAQIERVEE